MTEPRRWMQEGAPEEVARLLEAAQREAPSRAALERTLAAAAGVGAGLGTAAAAEAAAQGAAAGKGSAAAAAATGVGVAKGTAAVLQAKGLVVGVAIAVASAAGVYTAYDSQDGSGPRSAPSVSGHATPAAPAPAFEPAPELAAPAVIGASAEAVTAAADDAPVLVPAPRQVRQRAAAPVQRRKESRPRLSSGAAMERAVADDPPEAPATTQEPSSDVDADALAREVAQLREVYAALDAGDGARALRKLNAHRALGRGARLRPEARYLRMEALLTLGRTRAARALASRIVASEPGGAHALRARRVLGEATSSPPHDLQHAPASRSPARRTGDESQ